MIQTKNRILKDAVTHLKRQGKTVKASWNAGGDETLCQVYIEENGQEVEHDFMWQDLQIDWELTDLIVERLNLPNNGDQYNYGGGEIDVTPQGDVMITYSSKEYAYACYSCEQPEVKKNPVFPDPFGLRQYVHRAKISLIAEIDDCGEVQANVEIEVREGDEPTISVEAINFVKHTLSQLITQYAREDFPINDGAPVNDFGTYGISMSGQLTEAAEVAFTLLEEYTHLRISNKVTEVLLAYNGEEEE